MKKFILFASLFCFHLKGQIITTIAGTGTPGFSGDNGHAIQAMLNYPYHITFDAAGNLYIADNENNRIRKVDQSAIITTVAGNGNNSFTGDGGPATAAGLYTPTGVTFDQQGNMFVTDEDHFCIRKVNASGVITTVAGSPNNGGYAGDNGPATSAELLRPYECVADPQGNLYIADTENNRIRKVDASTGFISTIAGTGVSGYGGDGGPAVSAQIYNPSGIALDTAGNIYIADSYNNRVRRIDKTTGIITTVAGNGVAGFTGDGVQATASGLLSPRGVAIVQGNLFIADEGNQRVRKVNTAGVISTVAGNGTAGFSGDGGTATAAQLNSPVGICFDAFNNLYIADFQNQRIRKVIRLELGVEENTSSAGAALLYPNPCAGKFTIETGSDQKQLVEISDASGRIVWSETSNGTSTFNTSLPEGVYSVRISGEKTTQVKKLVIVK